MKKNTRKHDLDRIDSKRDNVKTEAGKNHRLAILANIYVQSQDEYVEELRLAFQSIYKIGQEARQKNDKEGMAFAEKDLQKIEAELVRYTTSPEFVAKVNKQVEKISKEEADKILSNSIKTKKGLHA